MSSRPSAPIASRRSRKAWLIGAKTVSSAAGSATASRSPPATTASTRMESSDSDAATDAIESPSPSSSGSGVGAKSDGLKGRSTASITCTRLLPAGTSVTRTIALLSVALMYTDSPMMSTTSGRPESASSTCPSLRSSAANTPGTTWFVSTRYLPACDASALDSSPKAASAVSKASLMGANTVNSASGSESTSSRFAWPSSLSSEVRTIASTSMDRSSTPIAAPAMEFSGITAGISSCAHAGAATSAMAATTIVNMVIIRDCIVSLSSLPSLSFFLSFFLFPL